MSNNIVLIGFMGSGKSSVGRELAKASNRVLIDIDSLIESNIGISINEIFNFYGEKYFRDYEKYICSFIKDNIKNAIISTGGGTPMIYDVKQLGKVVYLEVSFNEAMNRLGNSKIRPKLQSEPYELYNSRLMVYKNSSDVIIESKDKLEDIVNKILYELK